MGLLIHLRRIAMGTGVERCRVALLNCSVSDVGKHTHTPWVKHYMADMARVCTSDGFLNSPRTSCLYCFSIKYLRGTSPYQGLLNFFKHVHTFELRASLCLNIWILTCSHRMDQCTTPPLHTWFQCSIAEKLFFSREDLSHRLNLVNVLRTEGVIYCLGCLHKHQHEELILPQYSKCFVSLLQNQSDLISVLTIYW